MTIESGKYVSKTRLQVIKSLSTITAKNPQTGAVERVYGSWATQEDNLVIFEPNEPKVLNSDVINLPHVRQLIEKGILTRVY